MPDENIDVNVEETTVDPSTTENTEAPASTEEIEKPQSQSVPYDRFKEVVQQRDTYKELLSTVQPQVAQTTPKETDYYQPDVNVENLVKQEVEQRFGSLSRKLDLDKTIERNPDFFQYSDSIKAKVQENPNMSWEDAYKLAKFDASIIQAREAGKQEAIQQVQEKKKAVVESANKTKTQTIGSVGEINPLAKGPDGKFLYSTKELEDILPKS